MTDTATTDKRQSGFVTNPDYRVDFEPTAKRVRAVVGGTTIADSRRACLMLETGHRPVYYFPQADVRMDLMHRTTHDTY